MILLILYLVLGYWATGKTIYKNKILIEFEFGAIFCKRVLMGAIFGWILIPIALLRAIFHI